MHHFNAEAIAIPIQKIANQSGTNLEVVSPQWILHRESAKNIK
jgi:hypothetical protein